MHGEPYDRVITESHCHQKLVVPNSSSPGLPDNDSGTESVQTNQLRRKNACKTLWWCWHALYFTKKTHSETDISNEQLRWMQTCMQHCPKTCVPISGIPRGIWHVLMEQALIPGAKSFVPSPTYSLQIPHISLLQTVCGREIWVFGCNNPDRVPTPRGRFWRQIPASFLQHLPQVCQVGHTMDRCIKLLPITLTTCGVQQQQVYGRQEPTK